MQRPGEENLANKVKKFLEAMNSSENNEGYYSKLSKFSHINLRSPITSTEVFRASAPLKNLMIHEPSSDLIQPNYRDTAPNEEDFENSSRGKTREFGTTAIMISNIN